MLGDGSSVQRRATLSQTGNPKTIRQSDMLSDEAQLLASLQRMMSMPKGRVAVWLQLSRIPAPLPRPHHRRIAQAILETAAQHYRGEVFSLRSGDLVLLCQAPTHNGTEPAAHPAALPHTFARLFQTDLLTASELTQTWSLEHDGAALMARATALAD